MGCRRIWAVVHTEMSFCHSAKHQSCYNDFNSKCCILRCQAEIKMATKFLKNPDYKGLRERTKKD
ncbi:hypothetical protein BSU04nite_21840 [Bacillus spizizenii]|nr:hypothetical protein BSU04nite_21840 [Bacillus spizizenii]